VQAGRSARERLHRADHVFPRAHEGLEAVDEAAQLAFAAFEHGGALVQRCCAACDRACACACACGFDDGVELLQDLREALQHLVDGLTQLLLGGGQVGGPHLGGFLQPGHGLLVHGGRHGLTALPLRRAKQAATQPPHTPAPRGGDRTLAALHGVLLFSERLPVLSAGPRAP